MPAIWIVCLSHSSGDFIAFLGSSALSSQLDSCANFSTRKMNFLLFLPSSLLKTALHSGRLLSYVLHYIFLP